MAGMQAFLDDLYNTGTTKTASSEEAAMLSALENGMPKTASANPYENLSLAELQKLAADLTEQEQNPELPLEKVAESEVGGKVMAHAMFHEFELIKTALAAGLCRVCKEAPLDVEGSSICAACAAPE